MPSGLQGLLILVPDIELPLLVLAEHRLFLLLVGGEALFLLALKSGELGAVLLLLQIEATSLL